MDIIIAFVLFLCAIFTCMFNGLALTWALLLGFICFFLVGWRRGHKPSALLRMAAAGGKTALLAVRILLLIGLLTGLWRASGTIAFFVHTGIELISPRSFMLVAFLLPAVLSLSFGSAFGVASTSGIVLMTIARSGDANLAMAAGAAMSGAYFGERLSPASSALAMVAAVSGANLGQLRGRLWRSSLVPLGITLAVYGVASVLLPLQRVDTHMLTVLEQGFALNWLTALPALIMLALPLFKLSAALSISISCLVAALVALFVQGIPAGELLRICVLGYRTPQAELARVMSGGGLISMAAVVSIVLLSCTYSGLFTGTGMIDTIKQRMSHLAERIGLFGAHVVAGLCSCALFCNQSVGIVMSAQLLDSVYQSKTIPPMERGENIGNSVVNLAGLVPWCIASSVPLGIMGAELSALPCAVYLYLLPLCHWLSMRRRAKKQHKLLEHDPSKRFGGKQWTTTNCSI